MNLTYYLFPATLAKFLDRDRLGGQPPTRDSPGFGKRPAPSTIEVFEMSKTFEKHAITAEFAQKLVDAAVAKAAELKVPQCVAIVDDGGNLKAFVRMDGAALIPIEIAQSKAYTALFGFPTHDFFDFIKGDPSLVAGIPSRPRVAAFGGGYPIKVDGHIIGAIGVSGGTVEQDMQCAEAALQLVE